ncbi:IclR family transcriptional regulator [Marimonas arenosa]|uniref:IclR family transcriptional regulator n=1 Tax=Marimonas arenosa TaxID=1795305 RepID=A0AAE3WHM8_9RHOB|nr:IclR family transcriptional regulator [Marimonas arenosa]MDQ2091753.1 IclR family transcriptional regulator [Marimonas arenosa]
MGTTSKALSLLDFFSRATPRIGLSDLARRSGLNKATTHRLMGELANHGFVEQVGSGREYRLGPAFLRLAALREYTVPMRETVQHVLAGLAEATGETAHFSLLQGEILSTIAYAYSPAHGTAVRMEDAEILTFHGTSSGLAVLAFSPSDFVDKVLAGPLEARTEQTLTDPDRIRALLPGIRTAGMAMSIGGFEADVQSHAVPVFDAESACIGAVAVAAPVARMDDALSARIRVELMRRACHLTRLLGGFLPESLHKEEAAWMTSP